MATINISELKLLDWTLGDKCRHILLFNNLVSTISSLSWLVSPLTAGGDDGGELIMMSQAAATETQGKELDWRKRVADITLE